VGHRRLAWTKNKLGQPTNSPNLTAIGLDSPEYFLRTAKFGSNVFPVLAIARAWVKLSSGTLKEFLSPKFFGRVAGAGKGNRLKNDFFVPLSIGERSRYLKILDSSLRSE